MEEEEHELHQLQRCEVFLPPQVLLHVRADGRQAVVRVHDDVDEGVHQADEEGLSSGQIFDSRPPVEDHGGMVVHVKEGDLVVLLPQDEKDRVTELYDLGEEEPPAGSGHPHCQRTGAIVHRLTEVAVVGEPGRDQELMEHVGRQADHGEVVNNEDGSEVDGLPVFHQAGSKPDHTEVEKEDESHGNWGIDQQPGVCPLVAIVHKLLVCRQNTLPR